MTIHFQRGMWRKGETLKEAAIRETAEETKRIAKIVDEYEPFAEKYITPRGENCVCYMFFALDNGVSDNQSEDTHDIIWTQFANVEDTLSYDSLKNTWNSVKDTIIKILEKNQLLLGENINGKIDIFKYEEQRLKNVIALINNKIKYNEELFNKQKIQ